MLQPTAHDLGNFVDRINDDPSYSFTFVQLLSEIAQISRRVMSGGGDKPGHRIDVVSEAYKNLAVQGVDVPAVSGQLEGLLTRVAMGGTVAINQLLDRILPSNSVLQAALSGAGVSGVPVVPRSTIKKAIQMMCGVACGTLQNAVLGHQAGAGSAGQTASRSGQAAGSGQLGTAVASGGAVVDSGVATVQLELNIATIPPDSPDRGEFEDDFKVFNTVPPV